MYFSLFAIGEERENMIKRKKNINKRKDYTYHFVNGNTVTIKSGENGVSETDIELLHRIDDREVDNNYKNWRPEKTKQEKQEIKEWKEKHSKMVKDKYGYEMSKSELNQASNEKFPRNYNLSFDYKEDSSDSEDKAICSLKASSDFKLSQEFQKEELRKEWSYLTDLQFEVIWMLGYEGYTRTNIAEILNISVTGVCKHIDRAKKKLIKNKKDLR